MHGTRVRIDEMFSMPDGSMLKHPGDWNGSPGQIINCRCISVAVIEEVTKEEEGVEFKSEKNQLLYDEYLTKYGKWELPDFKKNFIEEVGPDIMNSLSSWQGKTTTKEALGLKYKTYLMEKKTKICRVPRLESVEHIKEAAFKITDESYIKLRALTQAYYKKEGTNHVILYRGVDGDHGMNYAAYCREMRKVHPDTAVFGELDVDIKEDVIVGYSTKKEEASKFGFRREGITVGKKIFVKDIVVSDSVWKKESCLYEHEFIVVGGDMKLKMEQIQFWEGDDLL